MSISLSISLALILGLTVGSTVPNAPSTVIFRDPPKTYYCPFGVSTQLADDFSSVVITYSGQAQGSLILDNDRQAHSKTCLVGVWLQFGESDNQYAIEKIQYDGTLDGGNAIETTTVLSGHYGPMFWTPALLSESGQAVNASRLQYSSKWSPKFAVRTVFPSTLKGPMKQTLTLSWLGPGHDDTVYTCEWPDSAGNMDTLKQRCR